MTFSKKVGLILSISALAAFCAGVVISELGSKQSDELATSDAVELEDDIAPPRRTAEFAEPKSLAFSENEDFPIFSDVPPATLDSEAVESFVSTRWVGEYRVVFVDVDELRAVIRESEVNEILRIQLLDEKPVELIAAKAEEYSSGWQTGHAAWRGGVGNEELSSAVFVVDPSGELNGVINSSLLGRVKIEKVPDTNFHVIWKRAKGFYQPHD